MKRTPWGEALALAGLGALIVGGVGLLARPSATATPSVDISTPIVVVPPQVVALDGLESITVTSESLFEIRVARPADAYAWATDAPTTVVRGLASWELVDVTVHSATGAIPELPGDLWRDWDYGYQVATLDPTMIEPGAAVIIYTGYEAPLGDLTLTLTRDRGNDWAWPVLALGFGLVALGLVVLAAALIGFNPFRGAAARRGTGTSPEPEPVLEVEPEPTPAPKRPAPRAKKGGTP